MLVDIINEQSKSDEVGLIVINNVYDLQLIKTINQSVPVYLIERKPGSLSLFKIFTFNYSVYKFRPDIIHFHSHNAIRLLRGRWNAKTFLTIHGLFRPLTYLFRYDRLISISNTVKEDIRLRGQ